MDQVTRNRGVKVPSHSEVILIGYSGHGYVVADALLCSGFSILGYIDSVEKKANPYNLTYLGTETNENALQLLKSTAFLVSIGSNSIRKKISEELLHQGFEALNAIHPSSVISNSAKLGKGLMIMAGVAINPLAEIGDGVILNTNCTIEHECKIGSFAHIAPGAVLAGNVSIGDNTFIGANSVIKQGLTIGSNVIIGAGSVIINDVSDDVTIVGNPGKIIKSEKLNESK